MEEVWKTLLKKISGRKRDAVKGSWIKFYKGISEPLGYFSPNIIKVIQLSRMIWLAWEDKNGYKISTRKAEVKN